MIAFIYIPLMIFAFMQAFILNSSDNFNQKLPVILSIFIAMYAYTEKLNWHNIMDQRVNKMIAHISYCNLLVFSISIVDAYFDGLSFEGWLYYFRAFCLYLLAPAYPIIYMIFNYRQSSDEAAVH
jgi:hypothetical protein